LIPKVTPVVKKSWGEVNIQNISPSAGKILTDNILIVISKYVRSLSNDANQEILVIKEKILQSPVNRRIRR